MPALNLSGSLNFLRLFVNPTLCLPHYTVSTFDQLPVPLSQAFDPRSGEKRPDIRAVVLDKDNCFAVPYENTVHGPYRSKFDEIRAAYPGSKLLIVSNSAGTASDKDYAEAELVERNTGVKVLHHSTKKPGCHGEIMMHFRSAPEVGVTSPDQVAVVGDRLFTDVMMANMMGSYGIWIKDGTVPNNGLLTRLERGVSGFLLRRGHVPPDPRTTDLRRPLIVMWRPVSNVQQSSGQHGHTAILVSGDRSLSVTITTKPNSEAMTLGHLKLSSSYLGWIIGNARIQLVVL